MMLRIGRLSRAWWRWRRPLSRLRGTRRGDCGLMSVCTVFVLAVSPVNQQVVHKKLQYTEKGG